MINFYSLQVKMLPKQNQNISFKYEELDMHNKVRILKKTNKNIAKVLYE